MIQNSPFRGQIEDVDYVEQPSIDLQRASIIVQASQEQRHEDTDTEPLPVNQPRPIPKDLVRQLLSHLDPHSHRHPGSDRLAKAETWRSSVFAQRQVRRDPAPRARVG